MPEFLDCVVEDINRIKVLIDLDRPSLCFVYFDECEEHVELVTLLSALRGTPAGVDLGKLSWINIVAACSPCNTLHETWRDYLYWDVELEK